MYNDWYAYIIILASNQKKMLFCQADWRFQPPKLKFKYWSIKNRICLKNFQDDRIGGNTLKWIYGHWLTHIREQHFVLSSTT